VAALRYTVSRRRRIADDTKGARMTLLVLLLVLDAVLHAAILFRFGVKGNEPPLAFTFIDAALAILVFFAVPYALWATLVLSVAGLIGLTLAFGRLAHEKTLERVIWVLDVIVVLTAIYLLFAK